MPKHCTKKVAVATSTQVPKKSGTVQVFLHPGKRCGDAKNTSFSTKPTDVDSKNAKEHFKYDHTPIRFEDGKRHGNNYEYAVAIPGDIDNSHTDDSADWTTHEKLHEQLKKIGINHVIYSSRNDHRIKNKGAENEQSARPRFHVLFPLSKPLPDKDKYQKYCRWFIRKFKGDLKVCGFAQLLFGFGDCKKPIIHIYSEGRCIDEVLTDTDLAEAAACGGREGGREIVILHPVTNWSFLTLI